MMNILEIMNSESNSLNRQRKFYIVDFWDVSPHIETSLEIIYNLSKTGAKIYYSCFAYSTKMGNMSKVSKESDIKERLTRIYSYVQTIPNVTIIANLEEVNSYKQVAKCPKYPSSASLLQLNKKDCLIGSSILASLSTGEPLSIYPYLYTENHIQTIELMIDSYSHVYEAIRNS